ncbi:Bromoperoxidase/chloroperoxidase [Gracilaria domingensis]|nr:Bromoperoxidase/chloroperoxidase [Gracilaria domingensis]
MLPRIRAQQVQTAEAPSLADLLTMTTNPPNEALTAFFPPSIFNAQTPLAIRYALVGSVAQYEIFAACHPVALSFFGDKQYIPSRFCTDRDDKALIQTHMFYRLLASEFPIDSKPGEQFLIDNGLNPFDRSTNISTPVGWANAVSNRLIQYFVTDGWNSQGDLSKRDYRQQYQDYTSYAPVNQPHVNSQDLEFPLRWQPLTAPVDNRGLFASQQHVVPQIATNGKPLALSREQYEQRRAPPLYDNPNRRNALGRKDTKLAHRLIRNLFKRSANVTEEKVLISYMWENKFFSLGLFAAYYQDLLGLNDDIMIPLFFAEMLAQHDATLVAWKEKRRHDYVRPVTLIRKLLKGKKVCAWKGLKEGVGFVEADEWEPVVPIQPHSEYPSGSAVICTASLENLEIFLETIVLNGTGTVPAFEMDIVPGLVPNSPVEKTVKVVFNSLQEAVLSCGESRLNSGVHFDPSVPVGHRLGAGIGKAAFAHVMDLVKGRVPENCERCFET